MSRSHRGCYRRLIGGVGIGLGLLILVAGGYLGVVGVRRAQPIALPTVSADRAQPIGRVTTQLVTAAVDPTATRTMPRKVSVWFWYPARTNSDAATAAYAPGAWSGLHFPGVVGFGEGPFDKIRTRSVTDAPVASGTYGLVILQPGLGFAAPQYQSIAENLAAAGYVVAGVTPTHSANLTVIDGHPVKATTKGNPSDLDSHRGQSGATATRLIELWARDAVSVADAAHHGRLDSELDRHLGPGTLYVGHSFGGASALQACADDQGCRGAADLDGTQFGPVVSTGVRVPVLLLGSDDSCITGQCGAQATTNADDLQVARSLIRHSGEVSTHIFAGTRHFGFTDYAAYYLAAPLTSLIALGSQDGPARLVAISERLISFAGRTLGRR